MYQNAKCNLKKKVMLSVDKDVEKLEVLYIAFWNVRLQKTWLLWKVESGFCYVECAQ